MCIRKLLLLLLISAGLSVQSGTVFRKTFDNILPSRHTVAGYGRTQRQADRALVLATIEAGDYLIDAAPGVTLPTPDQEYKLKEFPADGFFELYAAPFYTGNAPYPLAELRQGDKTVLSLTLTKGKLLVAVGDAKAAVDTAEWAPCHHRQIQLVWSKEKTQVFFERKLAAELPQVPQGADTLKLFAAFQGLVDEISIGHGIPLVLDPDFDGDPQKFPAIAPSVPAMNRDNWKIPAGLKAENKDGGILFSWQGKADGSGAAAQCEAVWRVTGGEYLRGDFRWTKISWEYGSLNNFHLQFYDAEGKLLKTAGIDAKLVNSPQSMKSYMPMLISETGTESALGVPLHYFNYYQVPEKAVTLRFGCGFSGNPLAFQLNGVSFRKADPEKTPWFREPYSKQKIHPLTKISRKDADEILRKRTRAVPELKRVGDRVELFVNGRQMPVQILSQPLAGDYKWIDGFRKAGFPFYLSTVTIGRRCDHTESSPVWKENGELDIAVMEDAVRRIIRQNPDALVFLCISVCPPRSWLEQNKQELMVNKAGEYAVIRDYAVRGLYSRTFPDKSAHSWYPSTASVKYRHDMGKVLTATLKAFEKTDAAKAVVGIYVTGGDDGQFRFPPFPDFSAPALNSYRAFLKAAGRPDADRAEMPDPKALNKPPFPPYGDSPVADYWRWSTLVSYELRQYMYDTVKAAMPRVLVGGYENAMGLTGQSGFGRYKIAELANHAAPDFMISLPGYNRYRDDCDHPSGMKAYNGSMVLHKKLMIGEMDIRNPEMGPLGINNRSRNWQATHNALTFRNFLTLYASYCMSWGGGFHAYIMQPLWYNTEEAMASWARAAAVTSQAEGQPWDENRIAVFSDENSSYFHSTADVPAFFTRIHHRESTQYALWRSGVRCDYYLPGDLFHPEMQAPKILIFADAGTMTPEQAAKIRQKYGNGNRILIWIGHAGYLPEGNKETLQKVVGFRVVPKTLRKPLMDSKTGKMLWEPAFYATGFPVPAWVVKDPEALELAHYAGTSYVGMAEKRYADHTEIYLGQPGSLSPEFIRTLARRVGIRPVQEQNDLAVMGGGLLEIGAMTGPGKRKIFFPNGVKDLKCLTGQPILERGKDFIVIDMPYKDAAVFKMER